VSGYHAFRLTPGTDLREGIERYCRERDLAAVAVVTCVGSLTAAKLRLADAKAHERFEGPFEIVSLTGTMGAGGGHFHIALASAEGRTLGGHLVPGCRVHTTAEVVLQELAGIRFDRRRDPATGYAELVVEPAEDGPAPAAARESPGPGVLG
tara:strand:- start:297 stop:752 length:456 start_codon:yes stop_codon:yes gene_type:complete